MLLISLCYKRRWNGMIYCWTCLYEWRINTKGLLPNHYCADSESKCRHQSKIEGYFGFIFLQYNLSQSQPFYITTLTCGYELWGSDQKKDIADASGQNKVPQEGPGFTLREKVRSSVIH